MVNVGGLTIVEGQNGSGTLVSGDGRVVDTFVYIQWFELTGENDTIHFSNDLQWKGCAPGAGSDTIFGGVGIDDLYYGVATGTGISLDMKAGTVVDPWGSTDHFSAVESVRGSQDADVMSATGVGFAVNLEGNAGNDSISGGLAADTIIGGTGDDTIKGSDGIDELFGSDGDDKIYGAKDTGTPEP